MKHQLRNMKSVVWSSIGSKLYAATIVTLLSNEIKTCHVLLLSFTFSDKNVSHGYIFILYTKRILLVVLSFLGIHLRR